MILEVVDQYTYLGVTFNYNNKLYKSIEKQISQAKKAMFLLIPKSTSLDIPILRYSDIPMSYLF